MAKKYLDENGLATLWGLIKKYHNDNVPKNVVKSITTEGNNLTPDSDGKIEIPSAKYADSANSKPSEGGTIPKYMVDDIFDTKQKVENIISTGGEPNVIDKIATLKKDGTTIILPVSNKQVNIPHVSSGQTGLIDKEAYDNISKNTQDISNLNDAIIDNEKVVSAALNDLNTKKYELPSAGIPETDLSSDVLEKLNKGASGIREIWLGTGQYALDISNNGGEGVVNIPSTDTVNDVTGVIHTLKIENSTPIQVDDGQAIIPVSKKSGGSWDEGFISSEQADKLDKVAAGAQVNVLEKVKYQKLGTNGSVTTQDFTNSSKAVTIPLSNNGTPGLIQELHTTTDADADSKVTITNGKLNLPKATDTVRGVVALSEIDSKITNAIKDITSFEFDGPYAEISNLPTTGEKGIIYLVNNNGSGNNGFDEYIWINTSHIVGKPSYKYELLGTTEMDLSSYATKKDVATELGKLHKVATSGSYTDLVNVPTDLVTEGSLTTVLNDYVKESELVAITNDEINTICK